jgi:Na+/proline symporter
LLPVGLALLSVHVLPGDVEQSVLPLLAKSYLSPAVAIVFIIALISVVLSTIDGAILAPSTLIAHNLLRRFCGERYSTIRLCQFCILGVSAASVILALSGNDAFALLEASYATLLVALFVPLMAGLFFKKKNETSALWAMGVGTVLWIPELFIETALPLSLIATAGSLAAYIIHSRR